MKPNATSAVPMLALALVAVTGAAAAGEVCVRCDQPFALYRCEVVHPDAGPGTPVGFLCITELAKRHGHATCGVGAAGGEGCAGERVVLTPAPDRPLPVAARPPVAPVAGEGDAAAAPENAGAAVAESEKPGGDGQPKTVEELAKSTAEASQKGLKNAGDSVVDAAKKTGEVIGETGEVIGSAAKKTWRCLSSLFGNC